MAAMPEDDKGEEHVRLLSDQTLTEEAEEEEKVEDSKSVKDSEIVCDYWSSKREVWMSGVSGLGEQKVTVHNWKKDNPVLVTVHDIGMDHSRCFDSFFSVVCDQKTVFEHIAVMHVDLPGHSHESDESKQQSDTPRGPPDQSTMTLENLGRDLCAIVRKACDVMDESIGDTNTMMPRRRRIFGLAIGVAGHIVYHALTEPKQPFSGVMLINPRSPFQCSYFDWAMLSLGTELAWNQLWSAHSALGSMDSSSKLDGRAPWMTAYLRAFVQRSELPNLGDASQRTSSKKKKESTVDTQMLIVSSDWMSQSRLDECVQFQHRMPRAVCQFSQVESKSALVTCEDPHRLADVLERFLNSFGLYRTLLDKKYGHRKVVN